MSKAESKESIEKIDNNWISVEYKGNIHRIEIAKTPQQLTEAKELDDLVFAGHVGITMDELNEIANNGAILLMRDNYGKLIGESQVITSPISEHPHLDPNEAYNYGTAIYPGLQNNGLAQILYKAQEYVALEAGKSKSSLTVRLENAQSIRGRFKAGYYIVGYDPDHFGSFEEGGARLLMEKELSRKNGIVPPDILAGMVDRGKVRILKSQLDGFDLERNGLLVGIGVNSGDAIDFIAHQLVTKIFNNKNIGIGILKSSEVIEKIDKTSLLVFTDK